MNIGDETTAEALRIAEKRLLRLGYKHDPEDIGACARKILAPLGDQKQDAPTPLT